MGQRLEGEPSAAERKPCRPDKWRIRRCGELGVRVAANRICHGREVRAGIDPGEVVDVRVLLG